MSLSLVMPSGCSIITIAEDGNDLPAWTRRLRWPGAGDDHVALPAGGGEPRIWASRLDAAVLRAERPVLIVADGIGCFAASWWARLSPSHYVSKVAGAILFDPGAGPARAGGRDRFAAPAVSLPFPTVTVATDRFAGALPLPDWGGRTIDGARVRTGTVAWEEARRLMLRLTRRVVERDLDLAYALRGDSHAV